MATANEVRRDLKDGPAASIDRLLADKAREGRDPEGWSPPRGCWPIRRWPRTTRRGSKASWVYRMPFGPDPLVERLTLSWHGHFAASNARVDDLAAMRSQDVSPAIPGKC